MMDYLQSNSIYPYTGALGQERAQDPPPPAGLEWFESAFGQNTNMHYEFGYDNPEKINLEAMLGNIDVPTFSDNALHHLGPDASNYFANFDVPQATAEHVHLIRDTGEQRPFRNQDVGSVASVRFTSPQVADVVDARQSLTVADPPAPSLPPRSPTPVPSPSPQTTAPDIPSNLNISDDELDKDGSGSENELDFDEDGWVRGNQTHAARNPEKTTQKTKPLKKGRTLTQAEIASRELTRKRNQIAREGLTAATNALHAKHRLEREALAAEHNVKPEVVDRIITGATTWRKTRAPTLPNAIQHVKNINLDESKHLCSYRCIFTT